MKLSSDKPRILILRGISGSGKSTFAKELVEKDNEWIIVSRDTLRERMLGKADLERYFVQGMNFGVEEEITKQEHLAIAKALAAGHRVIIDNTNLKTKYLVEYAKIAVDFGLDPAKDIEFKTFDLMDVEEAYARVKARGEREVSKDVIQKQVDVLRNCRDIQFAKSNDYIPRKWHLPPFDVVPQKNAVGLPKAIICDLDGTLAHRDLLRHPYIHYRSFYEYDKCDTDLVDELVADVIKGLYDHGYKILFVSGRKSDCREQNLNFIERAIGLRREDIILLTRDETRDLYVENGRTFDDHDDVVKYRIFNEFIRGNYNVVGVLDDRKRVVALWEALGIRVLNVGLLNEDF